MCDIWQSQIHKSMSDGVTDVLAAMNRLTLDIVGLAGKPFSGSATSHAPQFHADWNCWIGNPDLGNCVFSFSRVRIRL